MSTLPKVRIVFISNSNWGSTVIMACHELVCLLKRLTLLVAQWEWHTLVVSIYIFFKLKPLTRLIICACTCHIDVSAYSFVKCRCKVLKFGFKF